MALANSFQVGLPYQQIYFCEGGYSHISLMIKSLNLLIGTYSSDLKDQYYVVTETKSFEEEERKKKPLWVARGKVKGENPLLRMMFIH